MHCTVYSRFIVCWVFAMIRYWCRATARCFLMHSFDVCSTVFLRKANIDKPLHFASAATYLCYADTESGRTDQRSQQVAWPCEYFDNIQHLHSRSLF